MRHKDRIQLPKSVVLSEINAVTHSIGDIASGKIQLVYEDSMEYMSETYIVRVPFDTKGGPDGLRTVITSELGDWLRCTVIENDNKSYKEVLATERVLNTAKVAFANKPYKVITQTGIFPISTETVEHLEREVNQ